MRKEITCVIIEDNPVSLQYLKEILTRESPDVRILATASTVDSGIDILLTTTPDVLFLDIKLGNNYSFEILDKINTRGIKIIFITGYENYRKDAFDHFALGYITKPFTPYDIVRIINRVREMKEASIDSIDKKRETSISKKEKEWILLHTGNEHQKVTLNHILSCEASGNYTIFHLWPQQSQILASNNLKFYEEKLKSHNFIRINRKNLINTGSVKSVYKRESVTLLDGSRYSISTHYRNNLDQLLIDFG